MLLELLLVTSAFGAPKYGPNAIPLSKPESRKYFRENDAKDFFRLISFYVPQINKQGCSAANLSLVLNAWRGSSDLDSDTKLVTIDELIEKFVDKDYKKAMTAKNLNDFDRAQVANSNLVKELQVAAKNLNLIKPGTKIEFFSAAEKGAKTRFFDHLKENEKSENDVIVISFMQGTLTADPEGPAHVATVGGYDAKRKLVLILDPDREWYEPYWSPQEKVFEAIADPKSDFKAPGWIYIKFR